MGVGEGVEAIERPVDVVARGIVQYRTIRFVEGPVSDETEIQAGG